MLKNMIKRRFAVICILVSASLMTSVIAPIATEAGDQIEIPEYSVGDYWIYNSTLINNISGEVRYEVNNIREVQDFWNTTHNCYQINRSMEFTMEVDDKIAEGIIKSEIYERTSDLFAIEEIVEANVSIVEDNYLESSYQHIYFQYPGPPTIFPLILGSEYDVSYNLTHTVIVTEDGEERIMIFEESALRNFSVSISDIFHTITTQAGTFECVEITVFEENDYINITTLRYYSLDVGRDVKREMIQEFQSGFSGLIMISGDELLEYERVSAFSISGFSYLGIYCLIGISAIILHRRFKNR